MVDGLRLDGFCSWGVIGLVALGGEGGAEMGLAPVDDILRFGLRERGRHVFISRRDDGGYNGTTIAPITNPNFTPKHLIPSRQPYAWPAGFQPDTQFFLRRSPV